MGKLLVVGSLNMDTVINVSKMPKRGETVLGKDISYVAGGKGANQAYAMGKLGAKVAMIGCIGADQNGLKLLQNLQSVGVDTKAIQIFQKQPTGIALITVEETGENSIVVIAGANSQLTKQWIVQQQKYMDDCDIVVAQLETPIESICAAAELAREKGKIFILDPAPAVKDLPESLLRHVSIIKPNETELQILTGRQTNTEQEIVSAAQVLLEKGVEKVVVTLGEKGAMLVTQEGYKTFSPIKVKAVDTTAAGDAFTAGFAMKLSEGCSCEEAITFATKVSSIVVTRKGAQTSIPSYEEVLKVL